MTIAAVIPTYNAAAFIEGTLASVFAQTRKPDEVIVVDDASTDDTAAIARKLGATVIVLAKNSGGPATPLNTGIAATTSDWIATLDHDDHWSSEWLNCAMVGSAYQSLDLMFGRTIACPVNDALTDLLYERCKVFCDSNYDPGTGTYRVERSRAYNRLAESLNFAVTCSSLVFRRKLWETIPFDVNVQRCCDYRFMQQVTAGRDIAFIDDVACHWVNSPASLYQRGDMDKLDRDLMYIYRKFRPNLLTIETRSILTDKCRRTANDLAYAARERGEYRRAFADYCNSLRYGGVNLTAVAGIAKLPVFALSAPLRRLRVAAKREGVYVAAKREDVCVATKREES